MRILIISQYYPPETGAPQNRLSGLARELKLLGHEMVILTAFPNYPGMEIHPGYRGKRYLQEEIEGIPVHRSWIYVTTNRSVPARLLNYFSFTFSAMWYHRKIKGKVDIVLCESPPLFLGLSGWWIARRKKADFVFNVSDLWPESAEKLGIITNRFFLRLATALEEFLYSSSAMITGQTRGIVNNIRKRFPDKPVHWLPNGIDAAVFDTVEDTEWRKTHGFSSDDFLVLYAGIIGIAQGLDILLDAARLLPPQSKAQLLLLGEGPEKERLLKRKEAEGLSNVHFLPLVSRDKMPSIIKTMDAAVIPLKKMDLFLGAIPSKIFEQLALAKPILLAVDGEARALFIDEGKCGRYVPPGAAKEMADAILELEADPVLRQQLGENGRTYVRKNFMRDEIAVNWLKALEQLNPPL